MNMLESNILQMGFSRASLTIEGIFDQVKSSKTARNFIAE